MIQCVYKVKNYWIKTTNALKNLTYVKKCHYKKLKQKIIKCLICFPNLKLFNHPSPSSTRALGSQFCLGARHLYLVSVSQRPGTVLHPQHLCCLLLGIYSINMHKICGSGFDWSTFQLTAVIFDRLWPKSPLVNITFLLPDHRAVVHLKEKTCKCLGPGPSMGCAREGVGNDLLASAIPL